LENKGANIYTDTWNNTQISINEMVKYGSAAWEWGHRTNIRIEPVQMRTLQNFSQVNTKRKKY
jgi:hypothetical protein